MKAQNTTHGYPMMVRVEKSVGERVPAWVCRSVGICRSGGTGELMELPILTDWSARAPREGARVKARVGDIASFVCLSSSLGPR